MNALMCTLLLVALCDPAGSFPSVGHKLPAPQQPVIQSVHSRVRRASPDPSDRDVCNGKKPMPVTQVNTTEQLQKLRAAMRDTSKTGGQAVNGYIVPMDDEHQSEYVSNHDMRVQFISGFSGSAGTAVILSNKAALWTDGRYFLQAEDELDCNWILMKTGEPGTPSISDWLEAELPASGRASADAKCLSYDKWMAYRYPLVEIPNNLVDDVWQQMGNRPVKPNNPLLVLDTQFAGVIWQNKVQAVRITAGNKSEVVVVTPLDQTAWLFNLRGTDVDYNPVFYSYAIIEEAKVSLYLLNPTGLLTPQVRKHLNTGATGSCVNMTGDCVTVKSYSEFFPDLQAINRSASVKKIWVSPRSSYAVYSTVGAGRVHLAPNPIRLMKARKNSVEIDGMRASQIRDSAVLIEFITMLEKEVKEGKVWTEISAADKLEEYRRAALYNKGLSFGTISAFGSNGAIIHYSPKSATNKVITTQGMYLLDSGGQYLDGTTDVTRTFHFGTPTEKEKEAYTLVLMGAIELARAVWPIGIYGRDIDAYARGPLWKTGLQYNHGTGHGLGAFLNVHEGPGRINIGYRATAHESSLYTGMFFSDEPGYYQEGEFGVRLETIVMVKKMNTKYRFGNKDYLGFESFTLVPFEPNLIDYDMLDMNQRKWLNAYHQKCRDEIAEKVLKPQNKMEAYNWVISRTQKIPDTPSYDASRANSICHNNILTATFLTILTFLLWKQY